MPRWIESKRQAWQWEMAGLERLRREHFVRAAFATPFAAVFDTTLFAVINLPFLLAVLSHSSNAMSLNLNNVAVAPYSMLIEVYLTDLPQLKPFNLLALERRAIAELLDCFARDDDRRDGVRVATRYLDRRHVDPSYVEGDMMDDIFKFSWLHPRVRGYYRESMLGLAQTDETLASAVELMLDKERDDERAAGSNRSKQAAPAPTKNGTTIQTTPTTETTKTIETIHMREPEPRPVIGEAPLPELPLSMPPLARDTDPLLDAAAHAREKGSPQLHGDVTLTPLDCMGNPACVRKRDAHR